MMICATHIGRLMARSKLWAWRRIVAGRYGMYVRRGGRAVWVRLADVEAAEGVTFSGAQLRAAGVSIDGIENGEVEHVVAA
jgi:hypothetical protein